MITIRDALGRSLRLPDSGSHDNPVVGDVFVVVTDNEPLGLVLVSRVFEDFVFAWVITTDSDAASFPALKIRLPHGEEVALWPESEFGLATAALGYRIANVLDEKTIRFLRLAPKEADLGPQAAFYPESSTQEASQALSMVVDSAWAIGDWDWPDEETGPWFLTRDFMDRVELPLADFEAAIGENASHVADLISGRVPLNRKEGEALLALLPEGVDGHQFLSSMPDLSGSDQDLILLELSMPSHKQDVSFVMQHRDLTERDARTAIVREGYALAARQATTNPRDAAKERIAQAVRTLTER